MEGAKEAAHEAGAAGRPLFRSKSITLAQVCVMSCVSNSSRGLLLLLPAPRYGGIIIPVDSFIDYFLEQACSHAPVQKRTRGSIKGWYEAFTDDLLIGLWLHDVHVHFLCPYLRSLIQSALV